MRTRTSQTGERGFTLVELVVVVAIIAVLSGMAVTRMAGSWGSTSLRVGARDLALAARYARDYAATRRVRSRLVIAVSEGRYWVEAENRGTDRARSGFERLGTSVGRARTLGAGTKFGAVRVEPRADAGAPGEPGRVTIVFEPTGEADAAAIVLTDGSRHWTLRVAPSSGRAELVEGEASQTVDDRKDLDL